MKKNMRKHILGIVFALATLGAAAENEPHRKGSFSLTFTETDPLGDFKEMHRRNMPEFDEPGTGKNTAYAVDSRTFEVVVPDSYDPKVPAPLFVWVSAGNSGKMENPYRASLDKRGFIYVGPNDAGNPVWPPFRYRSAIDAVYNMKKLYNIDARQVYFGGNSGGGRTASMGCIVYSDIFTGGGFYVIGCNFWDDLPGSKPGTFYPGFWKNRDAKLMKLAKNHSYVFLTGSKDFNRDGTIKAYNAYKKCAFPNLFYNETPGLAHATPPEADIEKAFAFLDKELRSNALADCAAAEKLLRTYKYADAAQKAYVAKARAPEATAIWEKIVARADNACDKATKTAKTPQEKIAKLKSTVKTYGLAAEKAQQEIERIESSPEFAAENEAEARFQEIRKAARTTPRAETVKALEELVAKYPNTSGAAKAAAVIKRMKAREP